MIAMQSTSSEPASAEESLPYGIGDLLESTELGHMRTFRPNKRLPRYGLVTGFSLDFKFVRVQHGESKDDFGMYHLDSWKLAEFVEGEVVEGRCGNG